MTDPLCILCGKRHPPEGPCDGPVVIHRAKTAQPKEDPK